MKQAIILAAGEGQRLRPFTVTRPKVMLSIADKPILQYVIEALAQNSIRNIIIVVGYKREQVFDYIGAGDQLGVEIIYITQNKPLGTAHALAQAMTATDNEFLVLPGDNLIEASTIAKFVTVEPNAILVKKKRNTAGYGVITTENGALKSIEEGSTETIDDIIDTGIYAFNRDIFSFVEDALGIPEVINKMLVQGHAISAQETYGTWLDIIYPWDILNLNNTVLHQNPAILRGTIENSVSIKGLVSVGRDTVIRSNSYIVGPIVIGDNCDIGPNVCILPATSIGDNVTILPFSEIENSVIGNDVNVGPGSIVQDSVIDEGCMIKGHFTACRGMAEVRINGEYHTVNVGAMIGAGCNLGNNVVAQPGVIIGNNSQIQSLKLISGRLPDRSIVL
ncbi:bifunctional sugar-1-phosphate nucleotidylyltransferase/acetyltransferase [Chloroflexota bacterium]